LGIISEGSANVPAELRQVSLVRTDNLRSLAQVAAVSRSGSRPDDEAVFDLLSDYAAPCCPPAKPNGVNVALTFKLNAMQPRWGFIVALSGWAA
jgi:hypothetical protein